jgi:hypothetical protein
MVFLAPILYIKAFQPGISSPGVGNPAIGENGPQPSQGCVKVVGLDHLAASERFLVVRNGPETSSDEIRRIYPGDRAYYFKQNGSWYHIVDLENQWFGWSHRDYLAPASCTENA